MRVRTTLAAAGAAALLALAGCGGDDGTDPGGDPAAAASGDELEQGLLYTACMRDHGVPMEDPKPGENGEIMLNLPPGVDDETLAAADEACKRYLPNGGEPKALDPELLEKLRKYSECMREHGIDDFPDPDPEGGIQYQNNRPPGDPEFAAAEEACAQYAGGPGRSLDGSGE